MRVSSCAHNFLGTYTSRYSDCDGYWLFGMLVGEVRELKIDLLNPSIGTTDSAPVTAAIRLAAQKFREQMEKAGLSASRVQEAQLDVTKLPDSQRGLVNGRMCAGYNVRFSAKVVYENGTIFKRELSVFVAPHNPAIETRSARGT